MEEKDQVNELCYSFQVLFSLADVPANVKQAPCSPEMTRHRFLKIIPSINYHGSRGTRCLLCLDEIKLPILWTAEGLVKALNDQKEWEKSVPIQQCIILHVFLFNCICKFYMLLSPSQFSLRLVFVATKNNRVTSSGIFLGLFYLK